MSATPFEKPQGTVEVPHIEVDEETKEIIKEILSQMKNPVEILFFTSNTCGNRDTNWCVPTEELLDLLAELAPPGKLILKKIKYEENSDASRSTMLSRKGSQLYTYLTVRLSTWARHLVRRLGRS